MAIACPNIHSKAWKALVNELQGNEVKAYQAFIENKEEIPDIESDIVKNCHVGK